MYFVSTSNKELQQDQQYEIELVIMSHNPFTHSGLSGSPDLFLRKHA